MSAGTSEREASEDPKDDHEKSTVYEAVRAIAEQRAIIEQAKGMLMFIYGIDADAAFELLRSQSQQHNIKVRLIAEQITKDLHELAQSHPLTQRLSYDRTVLTAHHRITSVNARQRDGQSKTRE